MRSCRTFHWYRSLLCFLALLNIKPGQTWQDAEQRLIGITPMMKFSNMNYGSDYAPNTRGS